MNADIHPEVTDFFAVARSNGAAKWADDADSKGLADVILDYISDLHTGALLSLDDIHGLACDLRGVALFLIDEANAASDRLYDAEISAEADAQDDDSSHDPEVCEGCDTEGHYPSDMASVLIDGEWVYRCYDCAKAHRPKEIG